MRYYWYRYRLWQIVILQRTWQIRGQGHGQFIHADGDVFIGQWRTGGASHASAQAVPLKITLGGLMTLMTQRFINGITMEYWYNGISLANHVCSDIRS